MTAHISHLRAVLGLQNALRVMGKEFRNPEVSLPRLLMFLEIAIRGESAHKELAKGLGMTKATASRNITLLSNLGLVTNYEYDNDRRYRTVTLTRKGHSALNRILNHLELIGGNKNVN